MFSPPQDPTAPGTKSPFGTWVQPSSWSHFPSHSLGTPCLYDPMEILPKCSFKLLSLSLCKEYPSSLSLLASSHQAYATHLKGHRLWAVFPDCPSLSSPEPTLSPLKLRLWGVMEPSLYHCVRDTHHSSLSWPVMCLPPTLLWGPREKYCAWLICVSLAPGTQWIFNL